MSTAIRRMTESELAKLAEKIAYRNGYDVGYDAAKRYEVQKAMEERCAEQGHNYENCCSILFRVYMRCKYCGSER